jgi:Family of unknown function (DUF6502)
MKGALKSAGLKAVARMLEPVVRLTLELGVGLAEFNQLVRAVHVRAAAETTPKGAPNYSRISMLTGVSRATAASILASTEEPPPERGVQRAERVLHGWWGDPYFCDRDGNPAILPLRGRRSFVALVNRYSGDPRVATLLKELLRVKAVRRLPDRRLEVLSRTVAPARWDPDGLESMGERARELLETLAHNLKNESGPRFARFVVNSDIDPRYVPMLVRHMTEQTQGLADSFEDALGNPEARIRARSTQGPTRLGMAFYLIEEPALPAPSTRPPANRARRPRGSA